jgi:hypothetical protein
LHRTRANRGCSLARGLVPKATKKVAFGTRAKLPPSEPLVADAMAHMQMLTPDSG